MESLYALFVIYYEYTGNLKFKEPITPKGCLCVIRYKEHRDLKNKLLKIRCLPALMYQFIRWNLINK